MAKELYIWKDHQELWKDPEILQNALYCCNATYLTNSFQFLYDSESKRNHSIESVDFCGYFTSEDGSSNTRILVTRDSKNRMIIAVRGSCTVEDWNSNFNIEYRIQNSIFQSMGKSHFIWYFRRSQSWSWILPQWLHEKGQ